MNTLYDAEIILANDNELRINVTDNATYCDPTANPEACGHVSIRNSANATQYRDIEVRDIYLCSG